MDAIKLIPEVELNNRLKTFIKNMTEYDPEWSLAVIMSKINLYYFTGTLQNGVLLIPRDKPATFFVHRSFERAILESNFNDIKDITSFKDIPSDFWTTKTAYIETERIPLAHYARLNKYSDFENVKSLENVVLKTRSIKSKLEIDFMRHAGRIQADILENIVPSILRTGMTEAELASHIQQSFLRQGCHGVCRVRSFGGELYMGQVCFGESALYPNPFNGPGGVRGLSPAAPFFASHERKLKEIDLISADCGATFHGYHTDKTVTYAYGAPLSEKAMDAHKKCLEIQLETRDMLKPGVAAQEVYNAIIKKQSKDFLDSFMGIGSSQVKFLGHGVGLEIDEFPVITSKWTDVIEENMVIAIEPKSWVINEGMVGIENSFLVTPNGGKCITGNENALINRFNN